VRLTIESQQSQHWLYTGTTMDLIEQLEVFVDQLVPGVLPLHPDPNFLGGYSPDLGLIPRDVQGIIVQQAQLTDVADGGDSAQKTGIAAFCNSSKDKALLPLFESGGIMVRHPSQFPWNNWKNCSRDQLMAYVGGCWRGGQYGIVSRLLVKHAERLFTCQNTEADKPGTTKNPPIGDPLAPHDVMTLRVGAGDGVGYLDLLGQLWLQLAIETADPDPQFEKNNLLVESIICGRLDLYVSVHPNYRENVRSYWSGWRNQGQIGEALIAVIDKELERYEGRVAIPLLPHHLIEFLRHLNLAEELRTVDPARLAALTARFAEAVLQDAADYLVNSAKFALAVAVRVLKGLGAIAEQIAKPLAALGEVPNAIRQALEVNGFTAEEVARAVRTAFPGIPHIDTPTTPHVDQAAWPHADAAPVHGDAAPVHSDFGVHGDTTAPHLDFGAFGGHTDEGGGHGDAGHTDAILTPHGDAILTPHVDEGPGPHVDVAPSAHVDGP
jgi:hypothetical protein